MNFCSDNVAGISPEIMAAIEKAAVEKAAADNAATAESNDPVRLGEQ